MNNNDYIRVLGGEVSKVLILIGRMKITKAGNAGIILISFVFLFCYCRQSSQIKWPVYSSTPPSKVLPVYHFAIHPLYNPAKLNKAYQPLIDYLNLRFDSVQFSLEASTDYSKFEKKYLSRKPEFLLPNPWQTLQAIDAGYKVIAMAGEKKDFKGIFIVRKDGGIKNPSDLKGKKISYPSSTALAACIMPQYYLHQHGINVNKEITNLYVGSQESSIMNVFLGNSVAGATWPPP